MEDADDGEQLKRNDLRLRIPIVRSGERCTGIARREKQSTTETGIGRCPIVRGANVVGTSHVDMAKRGNDRGCAFQTTARPEKGQTIDHSAATIWKQVVLDHLGTAQHGRIYGAAWGLEKQILGSLWDREQKHCCAGQRMTQQEPEERCAQQREPRAQGGTRPMEANRDSGAGGKAARHTEARTSQNLAAQRGGAAKAGRRTGLGAARTRHSVESSMRAARTVVGTHGPRSQQAGNTESSNLHTCIGDGDIRGSKRNKTGNDEGQRIAPSNDRAVNVNLKCMFQYASVIVNVDGMSVSEIMTTVREKPSYETGKRARGWGAVPAGDIHIAQSTAPLCVNMKSVNVKVNRNEFSQGAMRTNYRIGPTEQRRHARGGRRYRRVPKHGRTVTARVATTAHRLEIPTMKGNHARGEGGATRMNGVRMVRHDTLKVEQAAPRPAARRAVQPHPVK